MSDLGTLLGVGGSCFALGVALTNLVWTLTIKREHAKRMR